MLAGMQEDDLTIGNVFQTISEEDTMDVALAAAINVVEVEDEVIRKFEQCKNQADGTVTKTSPSIGMKARVRLAFELCREAINPTVSSDTAL